MVSMFPLHRRRLLAALFIQVGEAAINQPLGVRVGNDDRAGGAHRQRVEERLCQVRYAPCTLEKADDFALIVGNGEFIEGANATGDRSTMSALRTAMTLRPLNPKPE